MYDSCDETGSLVEAVAVLLHLLRVEEAGDGVEDVGRVRRVVVRVAAVVVGLDQGQPVLHGGLRALERLVNLEPEHRCHPKPN